MTSLAKMWRAACIAAALLGSTSAARAAPEPNRWHENHFPNVVLTTQDGKKVRFYDDLLRGKVVSINFIYTNCGDVCPLDTAQLRQVQKLLGPSVGQQVFMYSISVDPEYDTPDRLKRYMRMFDIKPGWTFLTGRRADIDLIQTKLGIRPVSRKEIKDHDARLVVGNERTAHWIKRSPYDDPLVLANLLSESLQGQSKGRFGTRLSYDRAVKITELSRGEYLFRTRCDSCHTIGGGDRLGPDLAGVAASRERAWLTRWIKEPDKMLAEKDPQALALQAKYRNMPMPNLGLNDIDAAALVEFLKAEDAKAMHKHSAKSKPHH
jgi:protein SCO1